MAATSGNRFWELRSTHGRAKIFESPDILWKAACEYFEWCEDNPLKEHDFVGKDAYEVHKNKMRPFLVTGLCIFLDCDEETLNNYGTKKGYEDFFGIISRIKDIIYTQKFTGAAAGFLNPNIIARDLGLSDKKDLEIGNKGATPFKWEIINEAEQENG